MRWRQTEKILIFTIVGGACGFAGGWLYLSIRNSSDMVVFEGAYEAVSLLFKTTVFGLITGGIIGIIKFKRSKP